MGDKPEVEAHLEGVLMKCLWDTGVMISLINDKVVKANWPGRKLHSVHEFLGNKLGVSAANNSEMPIEGLILLDVEMENSA